MRRGGAYEQPTSMDKETGMGLALSLIDEAASAAGFAGATTAATMMAIVHRRYGRPDVLEHTEVDKPVVGDDDVLVGDPDR